MSDAKAVVEAAIFAALTDGVEGAPVYQDAPDNAPLPIVVVGDLKSAKLPGKDRSDDRIVTVTIVTLVEADERAPLLRLQEQIETALDRVTFEPEGWALAAYFEEDEAVLQEDGETYAGISTFTVIALSD